MRDTSPHEEALGGVPFTWHAKKGEASSVLAGLALLIERV
jgi:hypothetical protein